MKITRISLKNLNSLQGNFDLDFAANPLLNQGLLLISGPTGAGKTTLLDAVCLALYACCPKIESNPNKEGRASMISYGEKEAFALVEFELNSKSYQAEFSMITKRKNVTEKHYLRHRPNKQANWETLEEGIKKLEKQIPELLSLSYQHFVRSVILAQGSFSQFLDGNLDEQKAILQRLTHTQQYEQISARAKDYKDQAKKAMDEVQHQLDFHQFQPEKLTAFQQESQDLDLELNNLEEQETQLNQALKLRQEERQLNLQQIQLNQDLQKHQTAVQAFQPQKQRLHQHLKLEHHAQDLQTLQTLNQQIQTLQTQIEQKEQIFQTQTLQDQKNEQIIIEKQTQFHKHQAQKPSLERLWQEVEELDRHATNLEKQKQEKQQTLQTQAQTLIQIQTQLEQHQRQTQTLKQTLTQIQQTLQNNPWSKFPTKLVEQINPSLLQNLLNLHQEQTRHTQALAKLEAELQQKKAQIQELNQKLQEQRHQSLNLDQLNQQYREEKQALEKAHEEKHKLKEAIKTFEDINQLSQDLIDNADEQEATQNKFLALSKEILNTTDQLEDLNQSLQKLEQDINDKKRQDLFAEHRHHLLNGQACPLCGSQEHPWANSSFLEQLQHHQLAELQAQYDKRQTQKIDKQQYFQSLELEQSRQETQLQNQEAQAQKLRSALAQAQKNYQQQLKNLNLERRRIETQTDWAETQALQADYLAHLELDLASTQESIEQQHRLQANIKAQETLLQNLNTDAQNYQNKQQELQTQLQIIQSNLAQTQSDWQAHFEAFQSPAIDWQHSPNLPQTLHDFTQKQALLQQKQIEIQANQTLLNHSQTNLSERQQILNQLNQDLQTLTTNLNQTLAQRQQQFGQQNLAQAKAIFEQTYQELNQDLQTLQTNQALFKQKLAQTLGELKVQKQDLQTKIQTQTQYTQNLNTIATQLGLPNLQALADQILDPKELAQLRQQEQNLDRETHSLQQRSQTLNQALTQLQTQVQHLAPEQDLQTQYQELKHTISQKRERLGFLKQAIIDQQERQIRLADLAQDFQLKKQEFNRWDELYACLGTAEGKSFSFSMFAQRFTLKQLLTLANQQLKYFLQGRYQLAMRPSPENADKIKAEQAFGFEVIDADQANYARSVKSLSGGERFLVSLALSLALSDFSRGGAIIETLFIDEGFGSLDAETLETAMQALYSLRQRGKHLIIISHVEQMRKAIPSQIQVQRRQGSSTFSQIEIKEVFDY